MGDFSSDFEAEYQKTIKSLEMYDTFALYYLYGKVEKFRSIPSHQQSYIKDLFTNRVNKLKTACTFNQKFINKCLESSTDLFTDKKMTKAEDDNIPENIYSEEFNNISHINIVLKQVCREWSVRTAEERSMSYGKIISKFNEIFDGADHTSMTVLVPGSGLGRLAYELSTTGCECVLNDYDLTMLIVSFPFLNNLIAPESYTIYPWINNWCNNFGGDKLLYGVSVPDISIRDDVRIKVVAGDFIPTFTYSEHASSFDCIVTSFFIDTNRNVITLIETIYVLLKNGGVWINLGPLMYHYSDTDNSIEPTFEEISHIILNCLSFELIGKIEYVTCTYFHNPNSMDRYDYTCPFFAVRKI